MKFSRLLPVAILLMACGNPSGPEPGPGPTPSILTAAFQGWEPPDRSPNSVPLIVDVSWTACPDSDFVSYSLYRALSPGVASNPSAEELAVMTQVSDTTFTDGQVEWETGYYYALKTSVASGDYSWSNEDTVAIGPEEAYGGPDTFLSDVSVGSGPTGICSIDLIDESFVSCYFNNGVYVLGSASVFFAVQDVIDVGAGPMDVCTDGSYVFVSCSGDDEIDVIDASSHAVVQTIPVGGHPVGLCYGSGQDLVLVACYDSDDVWVIDAGTLSVIGSIPVGDGPWDVCSSGGYTYTANRIDGTVSVIDLGAMSVIATLDTGTEPRNICALTDGSEVWVSDYSGDRIYLIDTETQSVDRYFAAGSGPADMHALENGQMVYLSCFLEGRVDMVDPVSGAILYSLYEVTRPLGICEATGGAHVLICSSAGNTVTAYEYDPYP